MKSWRTLAAAVVATLVVAGAAAAQAFPNRPIRLVVPFPPGTSSDFLGRTIGTALGEFYKVQVVADNRPGAGGLVGTPIVLTATPNGYTIGLFGPPYITSALLQAKRPYEPLTDSVPIVQVAGIPNIVGVSLAVPAKTFQEFVAYARGRPGQLNYASVGVGSIAHFGAEILNRAAGIKAVHVPYKILGDVWAEMFAGRVHYFVFAAPAAMPMVKEGRVRAVAVTTPNRIPALPDTPTVAQAGLPAAEHVAWFGIFAPAGTPRPIVAKLAADIAAVVRNPETKALFERQGADPVDDSTPEAFARLVKAEAARYEKLIKEAGIQSQ